MSDRLRAAFDQQGRACDRLGSPFMARLMPLVGARLDATTDIGVRCLAWEGDVSAAAQSVPLRLAGALHALVLGRAEPDLVAAYPPHAVDDAALWQAVNGAMTHHKDQIMDWLDRPPQTNEVRRAAAIIAGIWWGLARTGPVPVILSELGASAGLNLSLDRFALQVGPDLHGPADSPVRLTPDWRGPPPPPNPFSVSDRAGVDLSPLDPRDPADALRLQAYIWPDQPQRLARTRAAIALSDTQVAAGDAAPWLADRLARPFSGLHVVYTTIAAQYFPPETRAAIDLSLNAAGGCARPGAALLHLAMEPDDHSRGAGLSATLWYGSAPHHALLARVDFHAAWIAWRHPASPPAPFPVPNP